VAVSAPEPLADHHEPGAFDCGTPSLDDWLKRRARANQASGASRTFIVCDADEVVAYYALASGAISAISASGRFRRNMPEPIPVAVLARLVVDRAYQGKGLGRALFQDSALRVLNAASAISIRGMIVHAISEDAKAFYAKLGFDPSPLDPMTLMVTLADIRLNLRSAEK
jgi:GNAT superfamily N-acetyltransferase